jgi:hypothetical protein
MASHHRQMFFFLIRNADNKTQSCHSTYLFYAIIARMYIFASIYILKSPQTYFNTHPADSSLKCILALLQILLIYVRHDKKQQWYQLKWEEKKLRSQLFLKHNRKSLLGDFNTHKKCTHMHAKPARIYADMFKHGGESRRSLPKQTRWRMQSKSKVFSFFLEIRDVLM